jgi:hypothetical protein
MLTHKENFLRLLNTGKPEYVMGPWDANVPMDFYGVPFIYLMDPYSLAEGAPIGPGEEGLDMWGCKWVWLEGEPAATPSPFPEDLVLTDIKKWREQVAFPEIGGEDFSVQQAAIEAADLHDKLICTGMVCGIFERAHMLMGFEELLIAMLEEPEEVNALYGAIANHKLRVVDAILEHYRPDWIHSHDDWGSKTSMFFSPDTWRALIKPHWAQVYGYIRSKGIIVSHHSDTWNEPIVEDMADIGINIWQGVLPSNDIPVIQRRLAGRMALMGGIDAPTVDALGATEEQVRAEVRRALREYAPGGYFIPCITSEEAVTPGVQAIVEDELRKADVGVYG